MSNQMSMSIISLVEETSSLFQGNTEKGHYPATSTQKQHKSCVIYIPAHKIIIAIYIVRITVLRTLTLFSISFSLCGESLD